MSLIVQKFGGSSVGTLDRIHHVADKIVQTKKEGHQLVVVVSAMYGETDRLIQLAKNLTRHPDPREYDALISTGEQVSMALLSMALNARGCAARSFTGGQIRILTDEQHSNAHIQNIDTSRIEKELADDRVVIIAGFQGINAAGDITTLGRGGSDTTAVSLAAALKASECQIFTDVAGVYTTDPHLLPEAQLLPIISFDEMLEMSSQGTKVLQKRSVELASQHQIPIRVLSTFVDGCGTLVTFADQVQKRVISGIAVNHEATLITINGIPNTKQNQLTANKYFVEASINIELSLEPDNDQHKSELRFSLTRQDYAKGLTIAEKLAKELKATSTAINNKTARISIIGNGISTDQAIRVTLLQALNKARIENYMTTSSDLKLSFMVNEAQLKTGVQIIHQALELDKPVQAESPSRSLQPDSIPITL